MRSILTMAAVCGCAIAQSNIVPGLDVWLYDIERPTLWGRRGPTYPGGEVGITYSYRMCNPGSVQMPWEAPSASSSGMRTNHPTFVFLVVREEGSRIVQITGDDTFAKHGHGASNSTGICGSCQDPGTSSILGIGCRDSYSANTNANRYWLAPKDEIDPWTGIWDAFGSYFDRGDPDVGFPANNDGIRSLDPAMVAAFDSVDHLVTIKEADLIAGGRLFYMTHMIPVGEAGANHMNNFAHREMSASWDGTTWTFTDVTPTTLAGTVLQAWTGATLNSVHNGADDGYFFVASKVTEPQPGVHHYEYAVQNLNNKRGAASFRVPLCAAANVSAMGFRDVDGDPLNDWTWTRTLDELVCTAPAGNALRFNEIFNFWFDCDTPPESGDVVIDQADVGPGALQLAVAADVPLVSAAVIDMGPGCGAPAPALAGVGLPTVPNPGFALTVTTAPSAGVLLFASMVPDNVAIAPGCTQYLQTATTLTHGFFVANGSGVVNAPVPVPPLLLLGGWSVYWQAAALQTAGPVFGQFALSNGLQMRVGCH